MYVVFVFRMGMVVAMMGRPPQRAALYGGRADDRKDKLRRAGGLEGSMGKIPMVKPRDGKHAQDIERYRDGHGGGAPAYPDHAETGDMDQGEWQGAQAVKLSC